MSHGEVKMVFNRLFFSVETIPVLNASLNETRVRERTHTFHVEVLEIIKEHRLLNGKHYAVETLGNDIVISGERTEKGWDVSSGFSDLKEAVETLESPKEANLEIPDETLEDDSPHELVKLEDIKPNERQLLDAKKIYRFFEVKTKFTVWIERRIAVGRFVEGVDYYLVSQNWETSTGGTTSHEYWVTPDMAGHLALMEHGDEEKCKQARQYFLDLAHQQKGVIETKLLQDLVLDVKSMRVDLSEVKNKLDSPSHAKLIVSKAYCIPDGCMSLAEMRNQLIPCVSKGRISDALMAWKWDQYPYPHSSFDPAEVHPSQAFKKVVTIHGKSRTIEDFARWFIRESTLVKECDTVYKMNLQAFHEGKQILNMDFHLAKKNLHSVWLEKLKIRVSSE
jgi:phage anti-repressor protein